MRANWYLAAWVLLTTLLAVPLWADEPAEKAAEAEPTIQADTAATASHEELTAVKVEGEGGARLQTLSVTPDGKIVGLVAPARYAPIGEAGAKTPSEIHVFDGEGKELTKWTLPFTAQSVGVGPDGVIYAGGDGQLARYDAGGKLLNQVEVPHLAEVLKDKAALRERAEEQIKLQTESLSRSKTLIEEQVKKLEELGDKRTELQTQQLESYRNYLKDYETRIASFKTPSIEDTIKSLTSRLRIINGIAATEKDVYIACGELKGYGYAIWRMDADLANPVRVLGPVSGCCGQMDIQARGDHFFLAENTKKRVARYDRDGTFVSAFGESGRESKGLSFGGCCNPMNCRLLANGDIYTAESEGIVKRFSSGGEFLGLVGYAKLTGGCKNVAVAASPDAQRIYFCDLPGSRIIILAAKKPAAAAASGN
jgi:hypothetical protein